MCNNKKSDTFLSLLINAFYEIHVEFNIDSEAAVLDGQGRHLPTQFFRGQRQKSPSKLQNSRRATCIYLPQQLKSDTLCVNGIHLFYLNTILV